MAGACRHLPHTTTSILHTSPRSQILQSQRIHSSRHQPSRYYHVTDYALNAIFLLNTLPFTTVNTHPGLPFHPLAFTLLEALLHLRPAISRTTTLVSSPPTIRTRPAFLCTPPVATFSCHTPPLDSICQHLQSDIRSDHLWQLTRRLIVSAASCAGAAGPLRAPPTPLSLCTLSQPQTALCNSIRWTAHHACNGNNHGAITDKTFSPVCLWSSIDMPHVASDAGQDTSPARQLSHLALIHSSKTTRYFSAPCYMLHLCR